MAVSVWGLHCVWKPLVTILEQYSTYLVRDMTLNNLAFCIISQPFLHFVIKMPNAPNGFSGSRKNIWLPKCQKRVPVLTHGSTSTFFTYMYINNKSKYNQKCHYGRQIHLAIPAKIMAFLIQKLEGIFQIWCTSLALTAITEILLFAIESMLIRLP